MAHRAWRDRWGAGAGTGGDAGGVAREEGDVGCTGDVMVMSLLAVELPECWRVSFQSRRVAARRDLGLRVRTHFFHQRQFLSVPRVLVPGCGGCRLCRTVAHERRM